MEFWLYMLSLFFGPALIVYSVAFIKAYINAKKEINNKIALSEKLKKGEELDEFDKMILNEQIKKANLINDLNRRNMKYDMGIYNIFGTEDEKNMLITMVSYGLEPMIPVLAAMTSRPIL